MDSDSKIGEVLLYIVRHAEVAGDSEGTIRGLLNERLNDTGEQQAQELAEFFRDIPVSAVYSDDLKRTYHTAIAIAHCQNLEVAQDPDLRSWDLGSDLEGRSIEANADEIKELKLQPDKVPVGGQSWADFEAQTITAFNRYLSKAMTASAPIVLVVHGSGIQVMWDYMGIQDKSASYDSTPLATSGAAAVSMSRKGFSVKALRGAQELVDA